MMGSVYVECEEHTCAYNAKGRCIAERISIVLEEVANGLDEIACDTYEHRDAWIPEPESSAWDDLESDDWWEDGDR